jgi:hypothetical protein
MPRTFARPWRFAAALPAPDSATLGKGVIMHNNTTCIVRHSHLWVLRSRQPSSVARTCWRCTVVATHARHALAAGLAAASRRWRCRSANQRQPASACNTVQGTVRGVGCVSLEDLGNVHLLGSPESS